MTPRLHALVVVVTLALSPWQTSAVMAQERHFTHGAAEGGQVITNRDRLGFDETSSVHELPSSALTVQLNPGDNDLFVLEFDAQCSVTGGPGDYLSVQARLNGLLLDGDGISFFQPQDTFNLQACDTSVFNQTISKSWVIRLQNTTSSPVTYTFSIWVRVVDIQTENLVRVALDNRIVRFTRYN
jgi:hypothetical protein